MILDDHRLKINDPAIKYWINSAFGTDSIYERHSTYDTDSAYGVDLGPKNIKENHMLNTSKASKDFIDVIEEIQSTNRISSDEESKTQHHLETIQKVNL